jgi:hypothetical protein
MKKRLVAVLVAGTFALPTAGASSAVAIRSTDPTPSTVAVPSFGNCRLAFHEYAQKRRLSLQTGRPRGSA